MNKQHTIEEQYQHINTIIKLSQMVVEESQTIPDNLKQSYLTEYAANAVEAVQFRDKQSRTALNQLQNELLTPWNETADADSKRFWQMAKEQGLPFEQTDYLDTVLKRGRIANLTEYDFVQDVLVIGQQEGRITREQADQLEQMLDAYEQKKGRT
jgi:hypothetical protein